MLCLTTASPNVRILFVPPVQGGMCGEVILMVADVEVMSYRLNACVENVSGVSSGIVDRVFSVVRDMAQLVDSGSWCFRSMGTAFELLMNDYRDYDLGDRGMWGDIGQEWIYASDVRCGDVISRVVVRGKFYMSWLKVTRMVMLVGNRPGIARVTVAMGEAGEGVTVFYPHDDRVLVRRA